MPDIGPYGRTTAKARIAQVKMAYDKHARFAAAGALVNANRSAK
jgi:hypothetical protein